MSYSIFWGDDITGSHIIANISPNPAVTDSYQIARDSATNKFDVILNNTVLTCPRFPGHQF